MVWPLIDPAPLSLGPHIEQMALHLEAQSRGDIRKLIINISPGSTKSLLCNVVLPAWQWLQDPTTKFLYASFDSSLVGTRDGGKVIRLLQSDWFRARWGDMLLPGKPAANMFDTRAGGFRFATSPGGKGLGRHAKWRIVDDPNKPQDVMGTRAASKAAIRKTSEWAAGTLSSRATDQRTVLDTLIMQRLEEEDLAGEEIAKGGSVLLRIPMLYEESFPCVTFTDDGRRLGGDWRTQEGELMAPERFPLTVVEDMRDNRMGPDVFAAQCQQRPSRKGGSIFQREWWRFYHTSPGVPEPCLCDKCYPLKRTRPDCDKILSLRTCRVLPRTGFQTLSWDLAFKGLDTSDFIAGAPLLAAEDAIFMLDLFNKRVDITGSMNGIRAMSLAWPHAFDKLVEDKANGPAVEALLKDEIPGITMINPQGGKTGRAHAGSIYMSGGRFYLPHPSLAPWAWTVMAQHEAFPHGAFDDIVDVVSQYLVNLRAHGPGETFLRAMREIRRRANL